MRIGFDKWNCSQTEKNRYKVLGIDDLAEAFIKIRNLNSPQILDIGCSTGDAIQSLKKLLIKSKIRPFLVGIDTNKKALKKAKKVFNIVINGDIRKTDISYRFDIVICSRVALFINCTSKANIIKKCSYLIKPSGCLITDIDAYDHFSHIKFSKNVVTSNKINQHMHNFVIIMGKKTIINHSKQILKNWKKLSSHEKIEITIDGYLTYIIGKICGIFNRI